MKYDDATIKKLIEMWNEKYTSSQIGAELKITRSAVMGMVYRLKQRGLIDPLSHKPVPKPKPEPKEKKIIIRKKRTAPVFIKPKPVKHMPLTLMQLRTNSCRYVVNEGHASQFLFCGKPQEKGSYCMEHAQLCYIKPHRGTKKEREKISAFALKHIMPRV
jgi:hypothetical protein